MMWKVTHVILLNKIAIYQILHGAKTYKSIPIATAVDMSEKNYSCFMLVSTMNMAHYCNLNVFIHGIYW